MDDYRVSEVIANGQIDLNRDNFDENRDSQVNHSGSSDSQLESANGRRLVSQGKRKTKKALDTQNRILISALDLFREKGFDSTSMRDIADRAAVAVGASYYYYRTKEELVLSYYESECQQDIQFAQELSVQTSNFETRMKLFLFNKLERMQADRGFLNVLTKSLADTSGEAHELSEHFRLIQRKQMAAFSQLMEGSDLVVSEVILQQLPSLLWLYSVSLLMYWIKDQTPDQTATRRLIDQSLKLGFKLLRGTQFMDSSESVKQLHEVVTLLASEQSKLENLPAELVN